MNRVLTAERLSEAQLIEARTKAEVQRLEAETQATIQIAKARAQAGNANARLYLDFMGPKNSLNDINM